LREVDGAEFALFDSADAGRVAHIVSHKTANVRIAGNTTFEALPTDWGSNLLSGMARSISRESRIEQQKSRHKIADV
jgi:hypothetical protein